MAKLMLVGAGGFLGSVLRYSVGLWIFRFFEKPAAYAGTLAVNVCGCLLIGFLGGLAETRQIFSPEIRLLVFIGFLGGFTTFSTFGYETFSFTQEGRILTSLATVGMHLVLGLGAVWLGNGLSRCI